MSMTGVTLDANSGHVPVSKANDLKGMQHDEIDWTGDIEMHIFIVQSGTLFTVY